MLAKVGGVEVAFAGENGRRDADYFDRKLLSAYVNEDRMVTLYERSMRATGMEWSDNFSKRCRYFSLSQIVEMVLSRGVHGHVVECGCWRGHSAHMISSILRDHEFNDEFHIFDSFEGLSGLSEQDKNERFNLSAEEIEVQARTFACGEDLVRNNLKEFPFIRTYKGWIPTRFHEVKNHRFSLIHVDVDLYAPYRDTIEFFYPLLLSGGAMVFDDYGLSQFPGAKAAVDEALQKFSPSFFYQVPTGGAFLVA
jgi:hypothetical protein